MIDYLNQNVYLGVQFKNPTVEKGRKALYVTQDVVGDGNCGFR